MRDYCDTDRKLPANLVLDFDKAGLTFHPNLTGAVHEITR